MPLALIGRRYSEVDYCVDIAIFDLETSGLNADYGIILCGVIMPFRGKPESFRLDQYASYGRDRANDKKVVQEISDRLEDFDIWVTYNGKRFDVPFLNTRRVAHGLPKLSATKHIDIYWQARYKLKLHSCRLESVQEFLGLEVKKTRIDAKHWARALAGYKKDMDYIVDHCVKDVKVLEDVYNAMKQFVDVVHK